MNFFLKGENTYFIFFKYIVLFIIPLGYYNTISFFGSEFYVYFLYTLLSIISTFFYLIILQNRRMFVFKLFVFIVYYMAYYIKFYMIVYSINFDVNPIYKIALMGYLLEPYLNEKSLLYAYGVFSIVFFLITTVIFYLDKIKTRSHEVKIKIKSKSINIVCSFIILFFIISTFVRFFSSGSVIEAYAIVINTYVVSLLYITIIFILLKNNSMWRVKEMSVLFILSGVVQFVLFASKMYVILPFLYVVILQFESKKEIFKFKNVMICSTLFVIIYPFFNVYRSITKYQEDHDVVNIINKLNSAFNSHDVNYFMLSIYSIVGRFVGINGMIVLIDARNGLFKMIDFFSLLFNEKSVAKILTYDILEYDYKTGAATSTVGQAYFFTGNIMGTAVWVMTLIVISYLGLLRLKNSRDIVYQALYIYILVFFVVYFNGGIIFNYIVYQSFAIVFFLGTYKMFLIQKKRKRNSQYLLK